MDQTIDVRIRAQTSDLKVAMAQAARDTEQAAQKMKQSFSQAAVNLRHVSGQLSHQFSHMGHTIQTTMKMAAVSVKNSIVSMSGHFAGLLGSLSALPGGFAVLGVAAGALGFKKGIDETAKMTENAMDLGRALGISATAAGTFNLLLDDLGASQGELEGASKGMVRQLKVNEASMNAMGLTTRNTNGQLRPLNALITDGIDVLQGYKEGTDRNLAAQTLFGRGLDASSKLMGMSAQQYREMEAYAKSLGLEVGQRSVAAWRAFDDATDKANLGLKAIWTVIGDQLMPTVTVFINALSTILPYAITVLKAALATLCTQFELLGAICSHVWRTIEMGYQTTVVVITTLSAAMSRAIVGDFQGAATAIENASSDIALIWHKNLRATEQDVRATYQRIQALWTRDQPVAQNPHKTGKGYASHSDKGGEPNTAGGGLVAAWESELARLTLTFDEMKNSEGSFQHYSIEEERQFWRTKLALTQQGTQANMTVRKKIATLTHAINLKGFDDEMALLKQQEMDAANHAAKKLAVVEKEVALITKAYGKGSQAYEQIEKQRIQVVQEVSEQVLALHQQEQANEQHRALATIAFEQDQAQLAYDLQAITHAELLALEIAYESQRWAIKNKFAQARAALIDPDKDPIKAAEAAAVIEHIEMDHQAKLHELKHQLGLEQKKPEVAIFTQMEQGFSEAISHMITHAESLKAILSHLFNSIYKVFLQKMCVEPLAQAATRFAKEALLHRSLAAIQVSSQAASSAGVVTAKAAEASAVVGSNAAEGASGAAASQAAIPIVGPGLGTAAAIAMFAFIMGFMGKGGGAPTTTIREIPSAAGGFDIPDGMNPVTQLHEKEMVLPAEHAETIRGLRGSNVAFEALNFHITAMDSRDIKRFLLDNKMAVAEALKGALRDFKR